MVFRRNPWEEVIAGLGTAPVAVKVLVGGLAFGCVADTLEPLRPIAELLRLSPAVWEAGQVWRLVTYGLVGRGGISPWSIVQLVFVYWLLMQLVTWVGEKRARTIILGGIVVSGIAAAFAQAMSDQFGGPSCPAAPFWLMQGQNVIASVGIAAFAATNRYSTVTHTPYVFGMALPTRWLVPLQLLMAFGGVFSTGDVGGFVGVLVATAWGWTAMIPKRRG
ncbi:MAG: hypothetical protein ACE37F_02110 [Nannocystaceae bacterium]|nr:hypothetical protein [bacterium]